MLWPSTLVFVTLFETLHGGAKDSIKDTAERMRFFSIRQIHPLPKLQNFPLIGRSQLPRDLHLAILARRHLPDAHLNRGSVLDGQQQPDYADAREWVRWVWTPGLRASILLRRTRNELKEWPQSLDWSVIGGTGALYTPFFAQASYFAGLATNMWIITPLL